MIEIEFRVERDIVEAYKVVIPKYPKLLGRAFKGEMQQIAKKYLRKLKQEPGRPRYPIRWKSARQRRYVMAKLRRERNLPYRRTHQLSRGWQVKITKNAVELINPTPYAIFVQGDWAQPFHLDTGWPQAESTTSGLVEKLTDALIETWYAITTEVPKL